MMMTMQVVGMKQSGLSLHLPTGLRKRVNKLLTVLTSRNTTPQTPLELLERGNIKALRKLLQEVGLGPRLDRFAERMALVLPSCTCPTCTWDCTEKYTCARRVCRAVGPSRPCTNHVVCAHTRSRAFMSLRPHCRTHAGWPPKVPSVMHRV